MRRNDVGVLVYIVAILGIIGLWLLYNVAIPLAISWVLLKVFPNITWNLIQLTVVVALVRLALSTFTSRGGNK